MIYVGMEEDVTMRRIYFLKSEQRSGFDFKYSRTIFNCQKNSH